MSTPRISARPWARIRARVLEASRICWLCGHDGATDVDHVIPRSKAPELAFDISNLRPAHGVKGCATCGRKCNREKSDKLTWSAPKQSRVW